MDEYRLKYQNTVELTLLNAGSNWSVHEALVVAAQRQT